jgi:hypothetical protein
MVKTMEQKSAEFIALMASNGFAPNGEKMYDGRAVYSRFWSKDVEVVWYGQQQSTFEIKVDEAYGIPGIRIFKNGKLESRRDYSTPKRAITAMREIVTYAGFEEGRLWNYILTSQESGAKPSFKQSAKLQTSLQFTKEHSDDCLNWRYDRGQGRHSGLC